MIPVRFASLPLKDVAVIIPVTFTLENVAMPLAFIPEKLAPALTFPTSCTFVTDILLLFSYLSLKRS
jgi:hypothetical protein